MAAWPKELTPIAGGIPKKSSFSANRRVLRWSATSSLRVRKGSLFVTKLSLRGHFDEAYPKAIYRFDRLLRYATGLDFQPQVQVGGAVLDQLLAH